MIHKLLSRVGLNPSPTWTPAGLEMEIGRIGQSWLHAHGRPRWGVHFLLPERCRTPLLDQMLIDSRVQTRISAGLAKRAGMPIRVAMRWHDGPTIEATPGTVPHVLSVLRPGHEPILIAEPTLVVPESAIVSAGDGGRIPAWGAPAPGLLFEWDGLSERWLLSGSPEACLVRDATTRLSARPVDLWAGDVITAPQFQAIIEVKS